MFRKKATPWVMAMAMAMVGMMGTIEAQTIDKNWVRQNANNPHQARVAIRYADTQVKWTKSINDGGGDNGGFYGAAAAYREPFLNAAEAVGAPHVDVVGSPTAPRTSQVCWETAAWMKTGNNNKTFNEVVVQEISKQGLPPLNVVPGAEGNFYISNACINPYNP